MERDYAQEGEMWYNGIVQVSNADRAKGTVATGVRRETSGGEKEREQGRLIVR